MSVLLNITVDADATAKSYITVWPSGALRPNSSVINPEPGSVAAGSVLVPLGINGAVSIFNFAGQAQIVVDLAGYTLPVNASPTPGPQGPAGPTGPAGPAGPPGPEALPDYSYGSQGGTALPAAPLVTPTATASVEAGTYLVTADLTAFFSSASGPVRCVLTDNNGPALRDEVGTQLEAFAQPAQVPQHASLSLSGVVRLIAATNAALSCSMAPGSMVLTTAATLTLIPLDPAF